MTATSAPTSASANEREARPLSAPARTGRPRHWRLTTGPVTAVLILASLSLMLLDLRGGPTDTLRGIGATIGGPLQAMAESAFGPLRTGEFRRADAEELGRQVEALQDANRRLTLENDILAEAATAAVGSERALRWAQERSESAMTARVVAADPALDAGAVTIDIGAQDGVVPDSAVLVAGGLVGRVTSVTPTTSSVLLVTDPASSVAARVGPHAALLQGSGDPHGAHLSHLDPLAEVAVGQRVTTLGSDDGWPYPAGITVGTVRSVTGELGDLDRVVSVEPSVTLSELDHVIVLTEPALDGGGS